MGFHYYNELVDAIDMLGLYGFEGQNWDEFRPDVCAHLGREWCN